MLDPRRLQHQQAVIGTPRAQQRTKSSRTFISDSSCFRPVETYAHIPWKSPFTTNLSCWPTHVVYRATNYRSTRQNNSLLHGAWQNGFARHWVWTKPPRRSCIQVILVGNHRPQQQKKHFPDPPNPHKQVLTTVRFLPPGLSQVTQSEDGGNAFTGFHFGWVSFLNNTETKEAPVETLGMAFRLFS